MSEEFEEYCNGCDFPRKMDYRNTYIPSSCKQCFVPIAQENFKNCLQCERCLDSVCQPCERKLR